jgi:hAT family C-terminal dimerisation region
LATATTLDPRLKHSYWTAAGFHPVEIDKARSRVQEAWQEFKPPVDPQEKSSINSFYMQSHIERDELQLYLNESLYPVGPEVVELDLLRYWSTQEQFRPKLSQMAKKYLAVCANSTPSERCFSQAKLFIPHLWTGLEPESFKCTMLLSSWLDCLQHSEE